MSLKIIHILFISLSVLFSFGFAVWSLNAFNTDGNRMILWLGIFFFALGVILIIYGFRFLQKMKQFK